MGLNEQIEIRNRMSEQRYVIACILSAMAICLLLASSNYRLAVLESKTAMIAENNAPVPPQPIGVSVATWTGFAAFFGALIYLSSGLKYEWQAVKMTNSRDKSSADTSEPTENR